MRTVPATKAKCEAHLAHYPRPLWLEYHHVIPVAWQLYLWQQVRDKRTVCLCRTGHGNVHWWIVRTMRGLYDAGGGIVAASKNTGGRGIDLVTARIALERVEAVEPGSLDRLVSARHWGGMAGS